MKLRIEKAIYGGAGLARAEGKAIFVPFALPGELVEAHIAEDRGSYASAELDSVLEAFAGTSGRRLALTLANAADATISMRAMRRRWR